MMFVLVLVSLLDSFFGLVVAIVMRVEWELVVDEDMLKEIEFVENELNEEVRKYDVEVYSSEM